MYGWIILCIVEPHWLEEVDGGGGIERDVEILRNVNDLKKGIRSTQLAISGQFP